MTMSETVAVPPVALPGSRTVAEDVALDVSRLMDDVQKEVTALMLESVHKTASFCASLCAERIISARRDMHRRWMEERRELERLYTAGREGVTSPAPVSSASPTTTCPTLTPRQLGNMSGNYVASTSTMPALCQRAHLMSNREFCNEMASHTPYGNMVSLTVENGVPPSLPLPPPTLTTPHAEPTGVEPTVPSSAASRALCNPPAFEANGPLRAGPTSAPATVDAQSPETAAPSATYDCTFIDAYDAVQTLEERTHMCSRAMDLLDEALQAAAGASTGAMPSDSDCTSSGQVPTVSRAWTVKDELWRTSNESSPEQGGNKQYRGQGSPSDRNAARSSPVLPITNGAGIHQPGVEPVTSMTVRPAATGGSSWDNQRDKSATSASSGEATLTTGELFGS